MTWININSFTRENDTEGTLELYYDYYPGCRGIRDKYGAPETPDDPEEFEIYQTFFNGEEIELTENEASEVEKKIREKLNF